MYSAEQQDGGLDDHDDAAIVSSSSARRPADALEESGERGHQATADESRVDRDLPEPMPVDQPHRRRIIGGRVADTTPIGRSLAVTPRRRRRPHGVHDGLLALLVERGEERQAEVLAARPARSRAASPRGSPGGRRPAAGAAGGVVAAGLDAALAERARPARRGASRAAGVEVVDVARAVGHRRQRRRPRRGPSRRTAATAMRASFQPSSSGRSCSRTAACSASRREL